MISLLRLGHEELNPNLGAERLNTTTKPEIDLIKQKVSDRAWYVKSKAAKKSAEKMIADRVDQWIKEANKSGRRLGYETERRQGGIAALLKKPGIHAWDDFTVPMSMREVEPGVKLVMDTSKLSDPPEWQPRIIESEGDDA